MMRVLSATAGETAVARNARMSACASCACALVATLPVPIAHTGSYAITTLLHRHQPAALSALERDVPPVGLLEDLDDGRQLGLDDSLGPARLALLERLADAEDDGEPGADRGARLVRDELRRLAEERAALRVPCAARGQRAARDGTGGDGCAPRMTYGMPASTSCAGLQGRSSGQHQARCGNEHRPGARPT